MIGLVVMKAEDQRIINISGNILTITFYKPKKWAKSYKFHSIWTIYV